jgi:uncharacterized protein YndB with AHSA1/START domain
MSSIVLHQRVRADADAVWRSCTDPEGISRWQADRASGRIEPGGRLKLSYPALKLELELDVVEVVPRERLVLRNGATSVCFSFEPGQLTLSQHGFSSQDEAEGNASSWRLSLALLDHCLQTHPNRPRTVEWLVRTARTSAEAAHVFFSDEAALGAWLTRSSSGIHPDEGAYAQRLVSGQPMSGQVLACTPGRDLALSWREQEDSVLCLRTLPSPRSADERLIVVSWSRWTTSPAPAETLAELRAALDRLANVLNRPMRG